uniref:Uncharacterized protein n=1 Tax=Arundo donax TaxID=35708 RepID=A0A0A8YPT4_ARUDO
MHNFMFPNRSSLIGKDELVAVLKQRGNVLPEYVLAAQPLRRRLGGTFLKPMFYVELRLPRTTEGGPCYSVRVKHCQIIWSCGHCLPKRISGPSFPGLV